MLRLIPQTTLARQQTFASKCTWKRGMAQLVYLVLGFARAFAFSELSSIYRTIILTSSPEPTKYAITSSDGNKTNSQLPSDTTPIYLRPTVP
jgi:hypothetical protein